MKKLLTVLTLVFFLALGAFAGGRKETGPSTGGKVTINFYSATDHDSFLKKMVETYNATHPEVQVIYNSIPNDDYDDKIKVLAAGSSDMDVFWVRTPAQTQQYITNNALVDLGPFIQNSGLDLAPIRTTSLPGAMRDGKIYGLPTNYGAILAGTVISIIPIIVVYACAQKYIVEGIAYAGLKG